MTEYHKIETIFERDMKGTKRLIEGKFRNTHVEYLKDNQWIFTEKIDGTNVRIIWDGHNVSFGGRTDNAQMPTPLIQTLNKMFLGITNEQLFEQQFGEKEVVLYGEGYGGKIQSGSAYTQEQTFILFDIKVQGKFLSREAVEGIAKSFNIPVVPICLTGTIKEAIDYVRTKPNSLIAEQTKESEGVVGRPLVEFTDFRGNRIIVKIKVCDFC